MRAIFLTCILLMGLLGRVGAAETDQAGGDPGFVKGADLSLLPSLEEKGVKFEENGEAKDGLAIFKDYGFNYVRLRIFVNPNGTHGQVNTLAYTLALAKRVKQMGFRFLLDFHYSDGWADPGKQYIPEQWKGLSHGELIERVYHYTKDTLAAFQQAGCAPDMVQVGNEITNGMMWPAGGSLKTGSGKWDDFADLLKSGIKGVRDSGPMEVMIHVDRGGNKGVSKWFFENCAKRGVEFDVIGLSYYPFDNGPLKDLAENMDYLSKTYGKDIMVAETGFFAAGGFPGPDPYPTTPEGQKDFLDALMKTVAATPGGHGKGVFYWAPEWIKGAGYKKSGPGSNRALFDEDGNAFPGMEAFRYEPDGAQ
jgi:arabinogalactan endo-1,4-beta-galactosidase